MKNIVVAFDIADQAFRVYTKADWEKQIAQWRLELEEDDMLEVAEPDEQEIVELYYGDELFYEEFTI